MIRPIAKFWPGAVILWLIACSNLALGQAETNGFGRQTLSATNKLAWFTDEKRCEGEFDTNRLACVLWIVNHPSNESQQPPVCAISVNNKSTNVFNCWKTIPASYLKIDLLDAKGAPVKRTVRGSEFGTPPDEKGIQELVIKRHEAWRSGQTRNEGFSRITPTYSEQFAILSIPELFDLTQPGEYSLKIQMRLIQRVGGKNSIGLYT